MQKIKDRILLGIAAGIISTIPSRMINRLETAYGLSDARYNLMAANIFLPPDRVNTPEGRMVGAVTNHINTALTGVLITYLLAATGRDKALLKGAGVGAFSWVAIFGLTSRLLLPARSRKPLAPLLSLIDHTLFGGLCGLIVSKIGDDRLFPDRR